MIDNEVYELSLSQEVSLLQCKYTLFKQVINILAALKFKKEFDKAIMTEAINLAIERNDCLRISFFKDKKEIKQFFRDKVVLENIPYFEFATKEEFDKWYENYRKKPIKYLKGQVFEPNFIKNYNGEYLVFVKVCHMVIDVYGLNLVFNDIAGIYKALINNEELPVAPGEYKKVLINDIKIKHDENRVKADKDFFDHYFDDKEEPYYGCVAGLTKGWGKRFEKGKRSQAMSFFKVDTVPYGFNVPKVTVEKVVNYSKETKISISNIFFYCYNIASSLLNGYVRDFLPLELSNCRGTLAEKKCAGTKVQSVGCYTHIDYEKTFEEQIKHYSELQAIQYRHLGYSDTEFEMLVHRVYDSSLLSTYYGICFSLVPYETNEDYEFEIFSNGKGALGCYIAMMYNINTNEIFTCYDFQKLVGGEKEIKAYHDKFVEVINKVMDNPKMELKELI